MKEMTENRRIGGKGIDLWPKQTTNMQSCKRRAIMQQAIKRSADISHMSTRKLSKNMTIKANSDKDNILKNDQDNIQAKESTHQVERYTTMNLCMRGDQNKHGKIRVTMLSKAK